LGSYLPKSAGIFRKIEAKTTVYLQIDETGNEIEAGRIDNPSLGRPSAGGTDMGDPAVFDYDHAPINKLVRG
jgi:hypothetical protein